VINDALFVFGTTAPSGPRPPHSRGFYFTRRTRVSRTPLDEWYIRRKVLYLTTHNTHNRPHIHAPGGIQTQNLGRRAAADLRLRRAATGTGNNRRTFENVVQQKYVHFDISDWFTVDREIKTGVYLCYCNYEVWLNHSVTNQALIGKLHPYKKNVFGIYLVIWYFMRFFTVSLNIYDEVWGKKSTGTQK
jgi:hypothetical protein